jgi:hypothetical protein
VDEALRFGWIDGVRKSLDVHAPDPASRKVLAAESAAGRQA